MSQALTFARPYARAAFNLANEKGRLQAWSQLLSFSAQAASMPQVQSLIADPRLQSTQLVDLLLSPGEVDPSFRQFLLVLAENRRLALLVEVAALYEQHRAEAERVVKATVTSAQALDSDAISKLTASLKKRFGREVEIKATVDASLIGGAVIDAGDVVIDGSLRTRLARLGAALTH